jgi:hypothetical protein
LAEKGNVFPMTDGRKVVTLPPPGGDLTLPNEAAAYPPALHGMDAEAPTPPLGPIGPPGGNAQCTHPLPLVGVCGTTTEQGD